MIPVWTLLLKKKEDLNKKGGKNQSSIVVD